MPAHGYFIFQTSSIILDTLCCWRNAEHLHNVFIKNTTKFILYRQGMPHILISVPEELRADCPACSVRLWLNTYLPTSETTTTVCPPVTATIASHCANNITAMSFLRMRLRRKVNYDPTQFISLQVTSTRSNSFQLTPTDSNSTQLVSTRSNSFQVTPTHSNPLQQLTAQTAVASTL